ncbi:MAG: glycosyltransferase family 2 protein [Actinomycetota bacterium]|nr:glycosyltransferase family 2 protein [Actinomycetota bacterium]
MKVTVTICAYNFQDILTKTVQGIPSGLADEIILGDDASSDNTSIVGRELGLRVVRHEENRGYGGMQKTLYTEALRAGAEIVVLLHGDYQYDPGWLPLIVAPLQTGHADMSFGSRFAGLGDPRGGGMPSYRYYGNRITTGIENFLLGARFSDMHSGMRAFNRRCLLTVPFLSYSDAWVFDTQTTVDAVTSGLRVVEMPVPTRYDQDSSSLNIAGALRYVRSSLSVVLQTSLARGRRGRRWPVTGGPASRRSAYNPNLKPRRVEDIVCSYYVPDQTILTIGDRDMSLGDGWNQTLVQSSETPRGPDDARYGVLVVTDRGGRTSSEQMLRDLRPTLHDDALVVNAVGDDPTSSLRSAGYDLIGWWMCDGRGIAVGRPV